MSDINFKIERRWTTKSKLLLAAGIIIFGVVVGIIIHKVNKVERSVQAVEDILSGWNASIE